MNKNYLTIKRASIIAGLLLGSFAVAVLAESSTWRGPASSPPNCSSGDQGCDSPIHVGGQWQGKAGPLSIGTTNKINNNTPNLNVVGGTLLQNLAVTGSMAINSGNPHPGTVLVSTDNNGTVSWSGGNPQEGQVLTYSNGSVTWKDVTVNNGGGGGGGGPPVCSGSRTFTTSYLYWKDLPACATTMIIKLYGGGGGGSYYIRNASPGEGGAGGHYKEIKVRPIAADRTSGLLIHVANYGLSEGRTGDVDADMTQIFGLGAGAPYPNEPTKPNCNVGGARGDSSHVDRQNGANRSPVGGYELNPNRQDNQLATVDGGAGGRNCGIGGVDGKAALGPLGGSGGTNGAPGQQPGGGGGAGSAATGSPRNGAAGGKGMVIIEWSDAPWN